MKKRLPISIVAVVLLCVVRAHAQSDHTFVSTGGVDNATCGAFGTPCRTFAGALPQTNSGGEIIALTSGLYDDANITISKNITLTAAPGIHAELAHSAAEVPSITISNADKRVDTSIFISKSVTLTAAPGAHAEITPDTNTGSLITVNASTSDTVVLRNLNLKGLPVGDAINTSMGIEVTQVGSIHIENCAINGFHIFGIDVISADRIFIVHTNIKGGRDFVTGQGISEGIHLASGKASIDHCRIEDNLGAHSGGIAVEGARANVGDTVVTGAAVGFFLVGGNLNLDHCEASVNSIGIQALDGVVIVSNSIVTNNSAFGFQQANTSTFFSRGNNTVRHNGTNTDGTIHTISGT